MSEEKKSEEKFVIFQVGTNNWQCEEEPAPGSGVLHAAHHNAYNSMEGVVSYSIWPSKMQLDTEKTQIFRRNSTGFSLENLSFLRIQLNANIPEQSKGGYRIFELGDEDIPICESAGPMSKRRWHGMEQTEIDSFRMDLEKMVYEYMAVAEATEGCDISIIVAHHVHMNLYVVHNVLKKRKENGLSVPLFAVFVHGTGLKMYQNERAKLTDFPAKFEPLMVESQILSRAGDATYVNLAFAISDKTMDEFKEIFGKFDAERVIMSRNGIDTGIFHPIEDMTPDIVLKELTHIPMGADKPTDPIISEDGFDSLVVFVGRLAGWKRIPALLRAASVYEAALGRIATVIVGSGPKEALEELQSLNSSLKNKHVYFLGPRMQPVLARLYSAASVGVFPSKNEPFGMVFIECMACGTPVVGANSGGPRDFVTPEVGVLVDCIDSVEDLGKSVAKSVISAVSDDWKTTKREGCLKVAANFTVSAQCADIVTCARKFV